MFTIDELERAAETVHKVLPETPQIRWPLLDQRVKAQVWVKHENHTPIGTFKIRGALFYIAELRRKERWLMVWLVECQIPLLLTL